MIIPQGDWLVVMRHVRDTTSRGQVQRPGLREETARSIASDINARDLQDWNCWAIHKREY